MSLHRTPQKRTGQSNILSPTLRAIDDCQQQCLDGDARSWLAWIRENGGESQMIVNNPFSPIKRWDRLGSAKLFWIYAKLLHARKQRRAIYSQERRRSLLAAHASFGSR